MNSSARQEELSPPGGRYASLDVWRGLACLMLVVYHTTFYTNWGWRLSDPTTWSLGGFIVFLARRMWIGVPIFFVVSGYCIAASTQSGRDKLHSLGTFFWRRFRRIYPPLWAGCLFSTAFILLVSSSKTIYDSCHVPDLSYFSVGNWFGNLFAIETWRPHVTGGEKAFLMGNTWTLCYEEQFYAVVGLMLLASAPRFFTIAAAVTLVTLLVRHGARAAGWSLQGFFFDGHWLMFAAGILVYYGIHQASARQSGFVFAGLAALSLYGLVDRFLSLSRFERHLDAYLLTAGLFGILLIVLHPMDSMLSSSRWTRPLAACGRISYGIYLTHYPVVIVLSGLLARFGSREEWYTGAIVVPLCVAVSIPLGWLFHVTVERHFLNGRAEERKRVPLTFAFCVK